MKLEIWNHSGGLLPAGGLCGHGRRAVNDKWQNNSPLSDTRCEQHGQPGCEVGTARKANSPGVAAA